MSDSVPPLNTVSSDGVAVVGLEDTLFIYRGGNDLLSLYQDVDIERAQALASAWTKVVLSRRASCNRVGAQFQQVIVPEKSSIIPSLFPQTANTETLSLRAIDQRLQDDAEDSYLSLMAKLRTDVSAKQVFRKHDSHLSPYGAQQVVQLITQRLGVAPPPIVTFDEERSLSSDLGGKFEGLRLVEKVCYPSESELSQFSGPPVHRCFEQTPGHHVGTKSVWANTRAPIKKTVVCFGNSFFERGLSPSNLSWWAARYFQEFHFIWSPRMDVEYLRQVTADVCICQTVERFLILVPPC